MKNPSKEQIEKAKHLAETIIGTIGTGLSDELMMSNPALRELVTLVAVADGGDSETWPHVLAFARRMEAKLEANRHKGGREGWLRDHPWDLVERILDETVEVQECFRITGGKGSFWPNPMVEMVKTPEETANECADVANFCMMVADTVTHR